MDAMLYYEDLEIGVPQRYGTYKVTREEVIEFASKYDPQPFHLDDEAAKATYFGRLSASGWHTGSMAMRMVADQFKETGQMGLGSPGIDELRWLKPVYPGDTLSIESVLTAKRRSKSKPHMGLIWGETAVLNQDGETVMTYKSMGLVQTRDPNGSDSK
jgi:acyl dehydratase